MADIYPGVGCSMNIRNPKCDFFAQATPAIWRTFGGYPSVKQSNRYIITYKNREVTLLPTLPIRALVNNYVCVGAITLNASIGTVAVATAQPPQAPQTIVSRVIHQAEFKQVLSQV